MELITDELKPLIPPLYTNEEKERSETKVPLKIFDPCGRGTWYVTEWNGKDTLFGYCRSPLGEDCDELGYMSLAELQSTKNPLGLGMERDINWEPETTLEQVMSGEKI